MCRQASITTAPSEKCTTHSGGSSPLLILPRNVLTSCPPDLSLGWFQILKLTFKVTMTQADLGQHPPHIQESFAPCFWKLCSGPSSMDVVQNAYSLGKRDSYSVPDSLTGSSVLCCPVLLLPDVGCFKIATFPVAPFWKRSSAGWLLCSVHIGSCFWEHPRDYHMRQHHRRDRDCELTVPTTHCQQFGEMISILSIEIVRQNLLEGTWFWFSLSLV